ncbi:hypothetical protein Cyast_0912 [Cyanobacterium stanieri PCC 7202]|uniref:MAE-28990/MAE-18760-like HEPN domain-containing protein n=1 Tax=Cyanobacterium stanieri (strain ATCC 29140 / PCC 7202) TaxID=292563 RepID=K9YJ53_CYASC|nr:hypothetical protein Cyast_0912 [Cyanobacterium stanieri PCC 7202]
MQTVLDDFNKRAKEITDYVVFIRNLENQNIKISKENHGTKIDTELLKTLKATAYLLIYNLIESTMRLAIEYIFNDIKTKNVSFDNLRQELKTLIWQNIKNKSADKLTNNIINVGKDIIHASFDSSKLFSGNVDAKEIKETAKKFGFSYQTNNIHTRGGSDLLSIKTHRNNLAHGWESFNDVGKNATGENLIEISERVIEYLRQILENIDQYLANEEYLESNVER